MPVTVRTVTCALNLTRDRSTWEGALRSATEFLAAAQKRCEAAGHEVQTVRVETQPFEEYLDPADEESFLAGVGQLSEICTSLGLGFFNIGPARSVAAVQRIPQITARYSNIACSAAVPAVDGVVPDMEMADATARAVMEISRQTETGFGNFNFCASFNCGPGIPFFPAGYAPSPLPGGGSPSFAIGCQTSDLVAEAFEAAAAGGTRDLLAARDHVKAVFEREMKPLEALGRSLAETLPVTYAGIDASVAPAPHIVSLVTAFESLGLGRFGSPGTLAVCGVLTSALKSLDLQLVGYTGLMLPPLEDTGLAERCSAEEAPVRVHDLLSYSCVCGLGLDCVPIPGDADPAAVSALFCDAAVMAFRLGKPLTARLFPVPGKGAGERTDFSSPHLCNMRVMQL